MTDDVLYDDGNILLNAEGVTLRRYYFPTATAKRIPYRAIKEVHVRKMTWLTGKGRGWGSSHPGYWLPLDTGRPHKDTLVVLDLGRLVKPSFSPDDPEHVVTLIRDHLTPVSR